MALVLPREEEVEKIFSRILSSDDCCERLLDTFYDHLDDENRYVDPDSHHFAEVLLNAYKNGDVSALLLELCHRSMFDLLKEAYLIPKRFHGKAGENPILLTDADGKLLADKKNLVSKHEYKKFQEIYHAHDAAPRSKLYLADGYDLVRYYTSDMDIKEKHENKERGILRIRKSYICPKRRHTMSFGQLFIKSSRKLTLPLFFTVRKPEADPAKLLMNSACFSQSSNLNPKCFDILA